ncbi:MAG: NUDIX domain-containing protein [Planctomycetes bacterium]|nr:NUDIX domain-containing protein [Planctomycetota bacterium]
MVLANARGRTIGTASRSACHSDRSLVHKSVHIIVSGPGGRLVLQKRSLLKKIQPGKWDTSVGGHVLAGETVEQAAARELHEELGISGPAPVFLYQYLWESPVEREFVTTFALQWHGPITHHPEEIDEVRSWSLAEIASAPQDIFTPNFLHELSLYTALPQPPLP